MAPVEVTIFSDPSCPYGFNAQRQQAQLLWHYADAIDLTIRMIVLSEVRKSFEETRLTREMLVRGRERLMEQYEMPMSSGLPAYVPATIDACRAYVGARLHDPERAPALLRALRVRAISHDEPLDAAETLHGAARDAGVTAGALDAWLADDAVGDALRADMAAARAPVAEALALPHKLSSGSDPRYTAGSAVFERDGRVVAAPGFQPFAVYEVAMAALAPEAERRAAAESVDELLAWAPYPLATAEVAELRSVDIATARRELEDAGAGFTPVANDGYWAAA